MFYNEFTFLNNSTTYVRFASNYAIEKVAEGLQAKGLNRDVAIVRAKEVFGEESGKANLYLHNLQQFFEIELIQKVYEYISRKALFQDWIHFGSYDHLLKMAQDVRRGYLSETELKQIRQIAQANRFGIALIR